MADLRQHRVARTQAIADRDRSRDELYREILAMTPAERAQQPPMVYARLSAAQLEALLGGGVGPRAPASDPAPQSTFRPPRPWLVAELLRRLPAGGGALVAGLSAGALVVAVATAGLTLMPIIAAQLDGPTRPQQVVDGAWPTCRRLAATSDGCLYTVTRGLAWADAAVALGLPTEALKATNLHLASQPSLTTGERIIVWRGTGTLEP